MRGGLTRTGGLLILLGGIGSALSFLFLPFGIDPLNLRATNGLRLMQVYGEYIQRLYLNQSPDLAGNYASYRLSASLSYGSMWAILLVGALLSIFAVILIARGRSGIGLPLTCVLFSLITAASLFLVFFDWGVNGANFLEMMFQGGTPWTPLTRVGWWVSVGGVLLVLVGSVLAFLRRNERRMTYS